MKKGIIAFLFVALLCGVANADLNKNKEAFLNMRIIQLEAQLEDQNAKHADHIAQLGGMIDGLQTGIEQNMQEIADRIGALDQNQDGEISIEEATGAVRRAATDDPQLLQEPEFWITVIIGVVSGLFLMLKNWILAKVHIAGRAQAAKRGHPSASALITPEPVIVDGHAGVVEAKAGNEEHEV